MSEQQVEPRSENEINQEIDQELIKLQILRIKKNFKIDLNSLYMKLGDFMKDLPIHPAMRAQAFTFLDSGILWANEAIDQANITFENIELPENKSE
jgi:hypothetical protein